MDNAVCGNLQVCSELTIKEFSPNFSTQSMKYDKDTKTPTPKTWRLPTRIITLLLAYLFKLLLINTKHIRYYKDVHFMYTGEHECKDVGGR